MALDAKRDIDRRTSDRAPSPVLLHRKEEAPAIGPAFAHSSFDTRIWQLPGTAALLFDTSKLTLDDFRAMRTHPQINASLSVMAFMIHQNDWRIECDDKKIANMVEDNMRLIWTRLIRAMSQAWWAGYSPNALEYENVENGRWTYITKIRDMIPEECEVNWLEVDSSYTPPARHLPAGGAPFVRPKIKVFDGIKRQGLNYPIPPEASFWYPVFMENGDYYGRRLLKAAFMPWYFSMIVHLYANRYFERFGEPTPIGRAPFDDEFTYKDSSGDDRTMTGKQAMEGILQSLRNRNAVVLPSERDDSASGAGGRSEYLWDIEYLESQMRGADFERYLARLDEEMSLAIFTPTLLMRNGTQGSFNLGVQHTQTYLWALNALVSDMKEYIDRYIVERIKSINFNQNAPRCEWVPRAMGKDNPETIRAMLAALITGGMAKPDLEELGVASGMTLHEVKQVMDPGAQPGDVRDRSARQPRGDSSPGSRSVGESLPTGRQIAARIGGQITARWPKLDDWDPSFGFRRMFQGTLESQGWSSDEALGATTALYERLGAKIKSATQYADEFQGPEGFSSFVADMIETEIKGLETPG